MPSPPSQLNYASFLHPEPPEDEADIDELFVNRKDELDTARRQILSSVARPRRKILGVVGLARVGKSHFLRKLYRDPDILSEFRVTLPLVFPQGAAHRSILRQMLYDIYATLSIKAGESGLGDAMQPMQELLSVYAPAIADTGATLELSRKHSVVKSLLSQSTVTAGGKAGVNLLALFPALFQGLQGTDPSVLNSGDALKGNAIEASASGQQQESEGQQRGQEQGYKVTIPPLNPMAIRELIGLVHMLLRLRDPSWTTLLVIDDFDLLEREASGNLNPTELLNDLFWLASRIDGLYLLTTVRQDTYFTRDKNFLQVANLRPFPSGSPELREIYDRHVRCFHEGDDPFPPSFVATAAQRCDGRPGLFLEILNRASFDGHSENFDAFVANLWKEFAAANPDGARAIEEAARNEGYRLDKTHADAIRDSSLMFFALEDYSSKRHIVVKPWLAHHLLSRPDVPRTDRKAL